MTDVIARSAHNDVSQIVTVKSEIKDDYSQGFPYTSPPTHSIVYSTASPVILRLRHGLFTRGRLKEHIFRDVFISLFVCSFTACNYDLGLEFLKEKKCTHVRHLEHWIILWKPH